jgi:pimeloyl-ACP methyl ester carboxylesterase
MAGERVIKLGRSCGVMRSGANLDSTWLPLRECSLIRLLATLFHSLCLVLVSSLKMNPQSTGLWKKIKRIFKKGETDPVQAPPLSSASSPPQSKPSVQVAETFPGGVKVWRGCANADVDICFIHGLTGNRDSTWIAEGHTEPWPKSLLPTELPHLKARIITFGYDAYISRWGQASINQLTDHAANFLQKVVAEREKSDAVDRPLIFVAHSLGGLVCKQGLLMSKDSPEAHLQKLYGMTKGVIFMGTPHTGAWLADWSKIPADIFGVVKSTNTSLLRVLQTKDEHLLFINERFLSLLRTLREGIEGGTRLRVICFFEELGYPQIGCVVPKASATFASDTPIGIHANHRNMVKFATAEDDAFQSVAAELRRWTNELR